MLPAPLFFADPKPADLSKNFHTVSTCTGCNRILSKPATTLGTSEFLGKKNHKIFTFFFLKK